VTAEISSGAQFRRFPCCGIPIDAASLADAADAVIVRALSRRPGAVHLCNAYTLSLASKDEQLASCLRGGTFNFPDGMPLVWIGRRRGALLDDRVYGPDLMAETFDRGRASDLRHYLYGSTPEVIAALEQNLVSRFPGAQVVGAESPPFRELEPQELDDLVSRLRDSDADVVWVGLGTPRQDRFAAEMSTRIDRTFVAVGAAFDFHAGTLRQAPPWMQKRGLEWAYRLYREPRRLWRRYLIGNVRFVIVALRNRTADQLAGGLTP